MSENVAEKWILSIWRFIYCIRINDSSNTLIITNFLGLNLLLMTMVLWESYRTCVYHIGKTPPKVKCPSLSAPNPMVSSRNGFGLRALTERDFDLDDYFLYDIHKYYWIPFCEMRYSCLFLTNILRINMSTNKHTRRDWKLNLV